ncbi:lithostathine-2-like [Drosophila ananassae]|uniref:lithostathine-2-like n=1 Tax=Drosophila ananassae TaxID=7217 RepID=UPI000177CE8D|nr:lithostathine-2-like [Drosophila ananassae]
MLWPKLVCFVVVSFALCQPYQALPIYQETLSACPVNFTRLADKCLLVDTSWLNWYEADRHCHSINAGLLSIENETDLKAINDWLPVVAPNLLEFWTSGNKLNHPSKKLDYFWQSTGDKALYLPWADGEPTSDRGDCLALYANYIVSLGELVMEDHRLNVKDCTQWAPHICQTEPVQFQTHLCLNPDAFHEVQVPVWS